MTSAARLRREAHHDRAARGVARRRPTGAARSERRRSCARAGRRASREMPGPISGSAGAAAPALVTVQTRRRRGGEAAKTARRVSGVHATDATLPALREQGQRVHCARVISRRTAPRRRAGAASRDGRFRRLRSLRLSHRPDHPLLGRQPHLAAPTSSRRPHSRSRRASSALVPLGFKARAAARHRGADPAAQRDELQEGAADSQRARHDRLRLSRRVDGDRPQPDRRRSRSSMASASRRWCWRATRCWRSRRGALASRPRASAASAAPELTLASNVRRVGFTAACRRDEPHQS